MSLSMSGSPTMTETQMETKALAFQPQGQGPTLTQSPTIGKLAAALARAQGQIRGATKDEANPHLHTSYAGLSSSWDACREALSQNGLAVIQTVQQVRRPRRRALAESRPFPAAILDEDPVQDVLVTLLVHESGEWVRSVIRLLYSREEKGLRPMQALGSAITYARRYGLQAIVGVAAVDDDGETSGPAGSEDYRTQGPSYRPSYHASSGRGSTPAPAPVPPPPPPVPTETFEDMLRRVTAMGAGRFRVEDLLSYLGNRLIEAEMIDRATLEAPDNPETIDPARARQAIAVLYAQHPVRMTRTAERYLEVSAAAYQTNNQGVTP
ncbi:MAG: ERF family protein [Isosphaeraceae bacterium]|nr:ERF family protein [Isosphaeraceae bacterium]